MGKFFEPVPIVETKPVSIKLEIGLAARFDEYVKFLRRSKNEIVSGLLERAMSADTVFMERNGSPARESPRATKRKAKSITATA